MPKVPRAKADAEKARDASGWLDAATAEQTLQRLCGRWRDTMGSTYALRLDSEGIMEVRTTRPRGKTMRTRGLIRIQWKDDYGRVVWGRTGARALFTIAKLEDSSLTWQSNRSKPFHWDRQAGSWADEEVDEEESGSADSYTEDWAWTAPSGEAWEEGWDEYWDDGWGEGWWEEDWQDEEWARPQQDAQQQDDSVADAAKRRAELRKKLQETRRKVDAAASEKPETSAKRWKQNKPEKPVYRRVEWPGASQPSAPPGDTKREVGGGEEAAEASAALKSMLGIRTQHKGKGAAKGRVEKAEAPAAEAVAEPESARGAAQEREDVAPKEPERALPPAAHRAQDAGAAGEDARPKAAPSAPSPPVVVGSQEQKASPPLNHGREVGERLLNELCQGVASKAVAVQPVTYVPANVAPSPDTVHVNRLETVVQGFLGQPFYTPAWSNNNSGWAFDLQWVANTLEWYFSDMNLCGDLYLRSLMMPGEGWVPLMLLLSFPRLQSLGVDHLVLGQAAMVSQSLELDTTGHYTRIRDKNRRAQWLPVRLS